MATTKQKLAAEKIVENRGNISKSMRQVGYSPKTAKNPKNLTSSKGFGELCSEYGLTNDLLIKSLVADIKKKVGNRKQELELAAKLLGLMGKDNLSQDTEREQRPMYVVNFRKPEEVIGLSGERKFPRPIARAELDRYFGFDQDEGYDPEFY